MNEQTKHTPGKWVAQPQTNLASGKKEWVIKTPEIDSVSLIIATTPYAKNFDHHEANARLIAAAPELLRFLMMVMCCEANGNNQLLKESFFRAMPEIRAIGAKLLNDLNPESEA